MIPKQAKRVFKGVIFDVYQWQEKMFDGTYKTFEAVKRQPSVQLIVVVGDKLLLQEEEQPFFGKFLSIPGGIVDEGETPLEAAKRELLEEAGINASKVVLYRKTECFKRIEWDSYYYIMKGCKKTAEPHLDSGEKIKPVLVSFDQFIKRICGNEFRNKEFSRYIADMSRDKKKLEEFRKLLFE